MQLSVSTIFILFKITTRLLQPMKFLVFFVQRFVFFVLQIILEHKVHEEPQRALSF